MEIKRNSRGQFVKGGTSLRKVHGMSYTKFYGMWAHFKSRCSNPNVCNYANYGGRGITVCDKWSSFQGFKDDMYKSYLKHVKEFGEKDTQIDRKKNNQGYNIENCCWATIEEQSRNKRNIKTYPFNGKLTHIPDIAKELGVSGHLLRKRLARGYSLQKAFTSKKYTNQSDSPLNN